MKTLNPLIASLLALALLAAIGYGAWLGLQELVLLYGVLDTQVASVTAISVAALLLPTWIVAAAVRRVGQDRLAVPLREEKAATYRLFIDCWQQRLKQVESPSLEEGMATLDRLLVLCGSAALVEAHTRLRAIDAADLDALWPALQDALLKIRKELGAEPLAGEALRAVLASHAVVEPASAPLLVM